MNRWLRELQRRNVLRVAAAYAISAWLVLQVTDVLASLLQLPAWVGQAVVFILVVGFPVAVVLSWLYEFTSEGIQRDVEADAAGPVDPVAHRKLDFAIMGLMAVGLAWFAWDKFVREEAEPDTWFHGSIAVIPFTNMGADEDSAFFAAGIHDDLLTQLAKIPDLKVISRTSVMEYANTTKNLKLIGEELDVGHILEGGVQQAGNRIRINAQLIDARTDAHLWAETFDRELTTANVFEIQSELARLIANSLHATLAPQTAAAIARPPTVDLEAWRDYLAAQSPGIGWQVRHELLESAVAKDPRFALAWIGLADNWRAAFWFARDAYPDALDKSLDALARAEAIDPDLPQIHLSRGALLYQGYLDFESALHELELAERGLPGHAEIYEWRGNIHRYQGRMDEALAAHRRALELDPRSPYAYHELGGTLFMMRRYDEARAVYERGFEVFPDDPRALRESARISFNQTGDASALLRVHLRPDWKKGEGFEFQVANFAWMAGEMETAREFSARVTEGLPSLPAAVLQAGILAAAGDTAQANESLEAFVQEFGTAHDSEDPEPHALLGLAAALAGLGQTSEALEVTEQANDLFQSTEFNRYQATDFRLRLAQVVCQAGDLQGAETRFREILRDTNPYSLLSLVNSWPPCRERFENSEHYHRLEAEFGHFHSVDGDD